MPFKYKTESISTQLGISRNNILRAREGLRRRGMISFVSGKGHNTPVLYSIIYRIPNGTQEVAQNDTVCVTENGALSVTQYNIKEKDSDKDNSIENKGILMSLEKLESILSGDSLWHTQLLSGLSVEISQSELRELLKTFFVYQKKKWHKEREIDKVKKHFQNWLNQKLNSRKEYGTYKPEQNDPH